MDELFTADRKTKLIATQIEVDLRRWIQKEILSKKKFNELVDTDIFNQCFNYCVKRKKSLNELVDENLIYDNELLEFISFSNSIDILNKNKKLLDISSQKILEENYKGFLFAKEIRNTAEHGRIVTPNEYEDFINFCNKIIKNDHLFSRTKKEIDDLEKGISSTEYADDFVDEREGIHNLPSPEYEDTGFIERKDLNIQLKKKLKNSNVITFIGDAGSGKTALAVKKCYEYLNGEIENDFDGFIYHSFKTEQFSKGEVIDLQNEVNTSDKFFKSLGIVDHFDDPIKNLIKHLEDNKILLFLDNLENVLDNNIINFLEAFSLAEHKSKIFLTSRIPVGHGDISIKVGSFTDKEAIDYFERLCRHLQLNSIQSKLDASIKKKLVNQRLNNPLYIKFALNDLSSGTSIEKAFENQKDLLNYSFLNIYNQLDDISKKILEILYIIKKEISLSNICDLLENVDPNKVSESIRNLITKNILLISFKKTEAQYYSIRKEFILFIEKNEFFSNFQNANRIFKKHTQLNSFDSHIEININQIDKIPEGWNSFLCRKNSDKIAINKLHKVAKLIQSLTKRDQRNPLIYGVDKNSKKSIQAMNSEIKDILENLKISNKDFCEIYRMEGLYYLYKRDLEMVKKSFDAAITMQPDYPNLYNYYSDSLSKLQDLEGFKLQSMTTIKKFPENGDAQQHYLIAKMWLNEFDDEIDIIYKKVEKFLYQERVYLKQSRKIGMRLVRFHLSKAEYHINNFQNFDEAFISVKNAFAKFHELERKNLVDGFTLSALKKSTYMFAKLKDIFRASEEERILNELHDSLTEACTKYESFYNKGHKRALVGSIIKGKIEIEPKVKGAFIHLMDTFVIEYGMEKSKIYIPNKIIPKNIKNDSEISFKLEKFRNNKTGRYIFTAKQINQL